MEGRWAGLVRRYPPLAAVVVALLLAVFALPSALNLPQANPGQTLEYAPVPGDNGQTNPGGNLAGLGLGSSSTAPNSAGSSLSDGGLPGALPGSGTNPPGKPCVGNPPRQTADPLSPPCVSYFQGDNGGATYVGVTATEIKVVFRYLELQGNSRAGVVASNSSPPPSGMYDMDNPTDYNRYFMFTDLHNWEIYFNYHYQTYKRHVHFYAENYGDTQDYVQSGYTPSKASAQAADAENQLHPFADEDRTNLYSDTWTSYLVQHQAVSFGFITQQLASQYPGHYWSYSPPAEYVASQYATFVCSRVIEPGKVTFSGNNDHGSPRKYGLLLTDDPHAVDTRQVQDLAVQDMEKSCGFDPTKADTEYFHYSGAFTSTGPNSGWGTQNMAKMQAAGVTTILWPGGEESEDMTAAHNEHWYPEWVLLGDGLLDGNLMSAQQTDEVTNAWVVSPITMQNAGGQPVEPACLDALLEVDPTISRQGSDISIACDGYANLYDDIRQLFTGIQLAGPKLTPAAMDEGFHAIPAKPSTGPTVPACYYLPGDYTCVKDAVGEWFDVTTPEPVDDSSGCWRMWLGGARYLPGKWPGGDVNDRNQQRDPCNLYGGGLGTSLRPSG